MTDTLETGRELTVDIDSLAHGGEGVARADGLVIFVAGAVPGDTARVQLDDVKKRFARAQLLEILTPSPDRVPTRCPAAAAGAGCCNLSMVTPEAELKFKEQILRDQLQRIGRVEQLPEIEVIDLKPHAGWRTRFRLGVNDQGKAGFRVTGGNDIVVGKQCAQAPAGVLDEVLAGTYPAGAEIVVARDSEGHVAVVESRKAARGRSVTRRVRQLSGPEVLRQRVRETTFELDPLGFWQAHEQAPETYNNVIEQWLAESAPQDAGVVWDLYGGVGLFIPAVCAALPEARVVSVELSEQAAEFGSRALDGMPVEFVTGDVGKVVGSLPSPDVVILDPPRKGAGADVVARIAAHSPATVIHVGCDPATFARDIAAWREAGYELQRLTMINAFPGTYHSETFGLLTHG